MTILKSLLAATAALTLTATAAAAQDTPIGPKWWPSVHGADDQAGASNYVTPDKVIGAASLIKQGKAIKLGRDYEAAMPMFGSRVFALRIPGSPTGGTFGDNKVIWNDEFLATEIGQVGTQFDGLGHIGVRVSGEADGSGIRYYNGVTGTEIAGSYGLKKLGVEHVKPFFTTAHLVNIAAIKDAPMEAGHEITLADVEAAMAKDGKSGADIKQGDVVLFHTGWGANWIKDNDKFNSGEPGIGIEVAEWLVEKKIALVGADTWATEVVPNPDSKLAFPVHQILLTKHGIYNHENLATERLVEAGVHTFAYIYVPMPIVGATGSAGSPIAAW